MQKLTKHISLVLIIAVLASMFTFGALADESAPQSETTQVTLADLGDSSVERTKALYILSAADLELVSTAKATRAQFVDWTVKMLGMTGYDAPQVFADVSADYWAANSINTACGLNLITAGDTFNPDKAISLEEAEKIIVSALGYERAAFENGGWPAGYVAMASKLGITKGLAKDSDGMSVLSAVRMIDNTLDIRIMKTNYNGVYERSDDTILSEYLDIEIIEGKIVEVIKDEYQLKVNVNGANRLFNLSLDINPGLVVEDEATMYIADDGNIGEVVYIDYNGAIEVFYDYIAEVNESSYGEKYTTEAIKKVYLQNEDKEYKTDSDTIVLLNDVNALSVPVVIQNTFAKIIVRSGKIFKIEAYSLYEGGLIKSAVPDKLKYISGDINDNVMNGLESVDDLRIFIDGVPANSMYDLEADMVFDYYVSPDDEKLILVASSRRYSKVLEGSGKNTLILDGEDFAISPTYGLYVYSNSRSRFRKDASFENYLGKTVKAYVDDNMYVRYIKINDDLEYSDSFVGVLMATANETSALSTNGGKLKIYKISGGYGEKEFEVDSKKMAKSPIKMDYLRKYAGNDEGKSFLRFTTDNSGKIIKAEPVDLWGNTTTYTGTISKSNNYMINNIYMRTATLFTAFTNEDGDFTVKVLDWQNDLRETKFDTNVTVITDYDPLYNPKPTYVMFGKGSDSHMSQGTMSGVVETIKYGADDTVNLKFYNTYGRKYYTISRDYFKTTGIKEGMLIEWYYSRWGTEPIKIHTKENKDLTGDPSAWVVDNATYNSGVVSGFYKADKIMYRDGEVAQFMVNGEAGDLIPLNEYAIIYELVRTKDGNTFVENKGVNPLGYINENDDVWFKLVNWSPAPRSVYMVIYEKKSLTGN